MNEELLSAQEAGTALKLTTGRIYQLVHAGEIAAYRVGRAVLIPRGECEAWERSRRSRGSRREPIDAR